MMMLLIKTMTETIFTIDVEASDTIPNVKAKILMEYEVPPDQQALLFAGKRMTTGTLTDYGVKEFDVVMLVTPAVVWARRVGGMYQLLS